MSEEAAAACAQLIGLTRLELAAEGKYASLRGTRGLTSLRALEELSLRSFDPEARHPFPAPAAFPALRSYEYEISTWKDQPSLYVEPHATAAPVRLRCWAAGTASAGLPTPACLLRGDTPQSCLAAPHPAAHRSARARTPLQPNVQGNGARPAAAAASAAAYLGATLCSYSGGTLLFGGIGWLEERVSLRTVLGQMLPPGAPLTTLQLSGGFFGEIDAIDWADAAGHEGRLRGVTRLDVRGCSTGSLPELLALLPGLAELAIEECEQMQDSEHSCETESVDGARLLPALAELPRLTRLSLAGTQVLNMAALPPLPGALACVGGPRRRATEAWRFARTRAWAARPPAPGLSRRRRALGPHVNLRTSPRPARAQAWRAWRCPSTPSRSSSACAPRRWRPAPRCAACAWAPTASAGS